MQRFRVRVNDKVYEVEVEPLDLPAGLAPAVRDDREAASPPAKVSPSPSISAVKTPPPPAPGGKNKDIVAPMPGKVLKVLSQPGEQVQVGQVILVLEAMKMECDICSEYEGRLEAIRVKAGDSVETGDTLAVLQ